MQITKSKLLFTALITLAVSTAACEGSDLVEQETEVVQTFTKQVTVLDGENAVRLTVSSQNQAAIDAINSDSYSIHPLFERPEAPQSNALADGGEIAEGELEGSFSDVVIESDVLRLEDGAVGYALEKFVEAELVAATAMGCSYNTHIDTDNFARITKNGSVCTTGKISTRRFGFWSQRAFSNNLCPGDVMTDGRNPSDRVRARVCTGMAYTVSFF